MTATNQQRGRELTVVATMGRQRESTNHHPPSGGLSRPFQRGRHWPHVHDGVARGAAVALQVGQGEGGQAADAEPLMLPRQSVVGQVDLLVDHWELQLGVLMGRHLIMRDNMRVWHHEEQTVNFFVFISKWRGQSYGLQLFEQGVLRAALFGRLGHVEVKVVAVTQSVQTQNKRHVVLEQTGIWTTRSNQIFSIRKCFFRQLNSLSFAAIAK